MQRVCELLNDGLRTPYRASWPRSLDVLAALAQVIWLNVIIIILK